jgi:hypothetical protein
MDYFAFELDSVEVDNLVEADRLTAGFAWSRGVVAVERAIADQDERDAKGRDHDHWSARR